MTEEGHMSNLLVGTSTAFADSPQAVLRLLRKMAGLDLLTKVGFMLVAAWIMIAVFATNISPYSATETHASDILLRPSRAYPLGTDQLGRDILSRLLNGSRTVLILAPAATLIGLAFGSLLGIYSGYAGGILDEIIMRVLDVVMAFPEIVLYLLVLTAVGPSALNVVLIIGIGFIPRVGRVVRSAVLDVRTRSFIDAARLQGQSTLRIMAVQILPNIYGPIVVEGSTRIGYAIFVAATLSFLGLGVPPPTPDWGVMMNEGRPYVLVAPWTILFPALAIASLVVGVGLASDGIARRITRTG